MTEEYKCTTAVKILPQGKNIFVIFKLKWLSNVISGIVINSMFNA